MKTLIVNFPKLNIGGVENNIYEFMKYCILKKYRVIWMCPKPVHISDNYSDVLQNIEVLEAKRNIWGIWKYDKPSFDKNDDIYTLSFTPFDHDCMIKLMEEYKEFNIKNYYIVANTKGRFYFVEEYYYGFLRKIIYKKIKQIMHDWIECDNIRFYSELQIQAFENKYGIKMENHERLLVPYVFGIGSLDEEQLIVRAKREQFNIVSVSRFDFPHKQYLLSLIDLYGQLKEKYPQIHLHIGGYGHGEKLVYDHINKLDEEARKDIILYGQIKSEDMADFMKNMHLNISVAACVSCGAVNGVLSLPARNFCEEKCEVYGYLPDSRKMTTATCKGEPARPYIEEIINMSEKEYIKRCKDSYYTYAKESVNPEYLFEQPKQRKKEQKENHIYLQVIWIFKELSYKIHDVLTKRRNR